MAVKPAGSVDNVIEQTFPARVLQAKHPVLVQFWAEWCGPCIRVTPIVEQIAAEHAGVLDVVKVNVDEEPGLADRHGITSIPAFVVYADDTPAKAWTGAAPKPLLERSLGPFLR
ncbi:thioredoxin family protein [Streptomyces sp. NBC_00257]|uniref:thioredoxin family protein n=1 Tax=unclassified Streptomyces TaxID=2593676 RepID=UPI00225979E7|nr:MULTISPECIES: thioredoxin family protein [unclassified Streptomyces]MCX4398736.1 thioredoxin family protein [Streptomyces sp. NBC_01767]MCX4870948.1 thioredoxin family protein [Streptomyces sp. NBC_00906]MCX4901688.1 thioredoxin family protein [Streptomyces sp. NBC_00892]MCX5426930.1 thioredoxin family protein [Streptomyces sp. NBC_00062]WSP51028.1 thioredoxin family protein [Streptomyces sp. NBC_01243]